VWANFLPQYQHFPTCAETLVAKYQSPSLQELQISPSPYLEITGIANKCKNTYYHLITQGFYQTSELSNGIIKT